MTPPAYQWSNAGMIAAYPRSNEIIIIVPIIKLVWSGP
jgi:hypothetical protein